MSLDMGIIIVEGRVFAVEHKELKKRNAWVVKFDMTDNTGAVRINRFMEANEAKPILDNVKVKTPYFLVAFEDVKNMLVHQDNRTWVIDKDLGDTGIWFDDFLACRKHRFYAHRF